MVLAVRLFARELTASGICQFSRESVDVVATRENGRCDSCFEQHKVDAHGACLSCLEPAGAGLNGFVRRGRFRRALEDTERELHYAFAAGKDFNLEASEFIKAMAT